MGFSGKFIYDPGYDEIRILNVLCEGDFYGWRWAVVKGHFRSSIYSDITLYVDITKLQNIMDGAFQRLSFSHDADIFFECMMYHFIHSTMNVPMWDNGFKYTNFLYYNLEHDWTDEKRLITAIKGENSWDDMNTEEITNYVFRLLTRLAFAKYIRVMSVLDDYSYPND